MDILHIIESIDPADIDRAKQQASSMQNAPESRLRMVAFEE